MALWVRQMGTDSEESEGLVRTAGQQIGERGLRRKAK